MTDEESALLVARALEEGSGVREVAGSLIKRAFAKKSEDNLTAIVGLLDYGEADPRSGWLASLREKQAGAAAEAKKAADLAKVKAEIQAMKQHLQKRHRATGAAGGLGTGLNVPI